MHARILALTFLLIASPALAQRATPRLEVALLSSSPTVGASIRADGLLDFELQELLRNGFPAAMRFRLELWRVGGMFDEIEGDPVQWNMLVRYDPYTGEYNVVRSQGARFQEDFGGFPTLAAAEAAVLSKPYPVTLQPRRPGARYYYNVVVDVESLSVSDLDELQRWLRGELRPAVRGKRSPLSALREGFGTLLSRVLGGETRHYESRSGTFRA